MRLLIVDHNPLDSSVVRSLYQKLGDMRDIQLRVVVPSHWWNNYQTLRYEKTSWGSLPVAESHTLFSKRTHRLLYRGLRRHLKEFQPDLVYVNAEPENFQTFQVAYLCRRWMKKPFVFSSWRNIDHRAAGYPYKLQGFNRAAERYVLSHASHGIAFSETTRELFSGYGFEPMTVIPPPVDCSVFRSRPPEDLRVRLGLHHFTIGFAGRFVKEKGLDVLLRAAALLRFEYQLLLIGSGPELTRLKRLAGELGISEKIVWAGALAHTTMPAHISAMDVVVLPSRTGQYWREQFGRILIEALASGVPVVGTDSGEIPSVIGNAGLVTEEGNAHALAAALVRLRDDPSLRAEMVQKGLDRVHGRFSLDLVLEQYYRLFTSLAP
jgi:glycosyltransferase involved in cell wall biosynthesis